MSAKGNRTANMVTPTVSGTFFSSSASPRLCVGKRGSAAKGERLWQE